MSVDTRMEAGVNGLGGSRLGGVDDPAFREHGQIWTGEPNVLVCRTRTSTERNTRIISEDDAIEQLAPLGAETNGTSGVGGATLETQLLRAGLPDELLLFTHPAILGFGRLPIDDYDTPIELDPLEQRPFASGVTMHHNAIRGERGARS